MIGSILGRVALGGLAAGAVGLAVAAAVRHFRHDNDAAAGANLLAQAQRRPGDVRVMSFNIKAAHGPELLGAATPEERERNLRAIAAHIERADPDVVLLQEVEQDYARGGAFSMYDRLRELLHATDGAMSAPRIGAAIIPRNGYSIRDRADGSGNHVHSKPVDGSSVMTAEIATPGAGRTFTVVNGHVKPSSLPGLARRVAAVRDGTLDRADPFPRQVLVGGDFNTSTSAVARALDRVAPATDVFAHLGIDLAPSLARTTSPTPFGNTPWTVTDRDQLHLVDGFGAVSRAQVLAPRFGAGPHEGAELSDHRPIVADVRLADHSAG